MPRISQYPLGLSAPRLGRCPLWPAPGRGRCPAPRVWSWSCVCWCARQPAGGGAAGGGAAGPAAGPSHQLSARSPAGGSWTRTTVTCIHQIFFELLKIFLLRLYTRKWGSVVQRCLMTESGLGTATPLTAVSRLPTPLAISASLILSATLERLLKTLTLIKDREHETRCLWIRIFQDL